MPVLFGNTICKEFRRETGETVKALDGVSIQAEHGTLTALVGPDGAGKTTLIRLITGLLTPDSGELKVLDIDVTIDPQQVQSRIGYMPQIARLPEHMTAAELFELLRSLRGDVTVHEQLVEPFGLEGELSKKLKALSGGTRQKVNAVAAFLFSPELYVLDEPTAGLDPVSAGILKARILAERAQGRTVLLTSHVMSEIDELADHVIYLADGQVQYTGSVLALKRDMGHVQLERAIAELMLRGRAA